MHTSARTRTPAAHRARPLDDGQLLTLQEIPRVVREVRQAHGLTPGEAAADLGVPEHTVLCAERQPYRALFKIRKRLIERLTGCTLDGPYYRVRRVPSGD